MWLAPSRMAGVTFSHRMVRWLLVLMWWFATLQIWDCNGDCSLRGTRRAPSSSLSWCQVMSPVSHWRSWENTDAICMSIVVFHLVNKMREP
jgi:hypothetical protein